jgi:hypothetical protein
MQGLRTHTAMRHARLSLTAVWDHFLNMGGSIGRLEVDAYLHGMMPLPQPDRDCVAQSVNELLDDLARAGHGTCCRAPYSRTGTGADERGDLARGACPVNETGRPPAGAGSTTGTAGRPVPRPSLPPPVHRVARRER